MEWRATQARLEYYFARYCIHSTTYVRVQNMYLRENEAPMHRENRV